MNDEVIALYDYQANDAEELSIKKNEVLSLLDSDNNWWKVCFSYVYRLFTCQIILVNIL